MWVKAKLSFPNTDFSQLFTIVWEDRQTYVSNTRILPPALSLLGPVLPLSRGVCPILSSVWADQSPKEEVTVTERNRKAELLTWDRVYTSSYLNCICTGGKQHSQGFMIGVSSTLTVMSWGWEWEGMSSRVWKSFVSLFCLNITVWIPLQPEIWEALWDLMAYGVGFL